MALLWSLAACSQAGGAPASGASGTSAASAVGTSSAALAVSVSADRERYHSGEQILVTLSNRAGVSVFAPPPGGCSIVSLWRLDGQQWMNVDVCTTVNVYVTEIVAMSDLTRPLDPASQPPGATGPIVVGPISPSASGDDVTKLPTVAPWRSGDLTRVVPEGAIAPPFSVVGADLDPGSYRIGFSFAEGTVTGPVRTVYSDRFTVTD